MVVALIALPSVLHGCSSPTRPPDPPGGGQSMHLSFTQFDQTVEPILMNHGCDATGDCHGGGIRGTLQLSPPNAKDPQFDFEQVSLQVTAAPPESSAILTEPLALAAGGTPHAGNKPFASTSDPEYQAILSWILAGCSHELALLCACARALTLAFAHAGPCGPTTRRVRGPEREPLERRATPSAHFRSLVHGLEPAPSRRPSLCADPGAPVPEPDLDQPALASRQRLAVRVSRHVYLSQWLGLRADRLQPGQSARGAHTVNAIFRRPIAGRTSRTRPPATE
jgi:hypothetical protein